MELFHLRHNRKDQQAMIDLRFPSAISFFKNGKMSLTEHPQTAAITRVKARNLSVAEMKEVINELRELAKRLENELDVVKAKVEDEERYYLRHA